ncbi:hypothetical protein [Actinophytocola algeriensis]|uniref:Uncharacterized protein n=1 Tax=Actinophytocola algeriensis TaxID=1768010 RepID=A0A7W7VIX5_9PSEU|nr:hypothetical protein [Actinophytocola algeriensis]MBB4911505.1 hypothetical protein [Actinophytocola algeriensis]MBE1473507.1 hypothetical protein [Actinophytocola algeriensis]
MLVVADPNHDVLVVHPLTALDTMITTYHASLTTVGNSNGSRAGDER